MRDLGLGSGTVIAAVHAGGRIDGYVPAGHPVTPRSEPLPPRVPGCAVKVATSLANRVGTPSMANLPRAELPERLAQRGAEATTQQTDPHIAHAYLRSNGESREQISTKDSTATTRTALARCRRDRSAVRISTRAAVTTGEAPCQICPPSQSQTRRSAST